MNGDHSRDADYPQDSYHNKRILFALSLVRMDTFPQASRRTDKPMYWEAAPPKSMLPIVQVLCRQSKSCRLV